MPRPTDTIAALATPVGTAAIAVVRASGPDTARLAREIFGATPPPRVATHSDYRDRAGVVVDDVLVTFFAGPRSYTGEDSLEVSCHGNPFIAQKILEDLFARGCRPAEPGEFTQRAFLHGQMDLSQAEAVMDLIHARSEKALAAANQQLRGSLGRQMNALIDRLLQVLARVEAYIDFPDEDLPPEDRVLVARELTQLTRETDRLLATSHYGQMLRDGIKTVIVGAPNVGKSSLLNRLVGSERALVSPEPGTTRDFIEERILVGPHCLRVIDTAGLNPSPAPLEKLGML
jgi:tRNA modification GTPase